MFWGSASVRENFTLVEAAPNFSWELNTVRCYALQCVFELPFVLLKSCVFARARRILSESLYCWRTFNLWLMQISWFNGDFFESLQYEFI
jgi:hypothetical protein